MEEQVLELVREMCRPQESDELLHCLCAAACRTLRGMLREDVQEEDCAVLFRLAAAWVSADWLKQGRGWEGVTSLSAGGMTVHKNAGGDSLSEQALRLLAPYLRDEGFVFLGVKG